MKRVKEREREREREREKERERTVFKNRMICQEVKHNKGKCSPRLFRQNNLYWNEVLNRKILKSLLPTKSM